ncbi:hypothetical protein GJ744_008081 [Endocarpon pusillum]|uniref:Uncharacterized protein n=1 Tax=Endocarpon pusillum TaxID=364733 RepID=A0A8H7AHS6_9EURO|nr:hypothetical protein GJ744_008081 [Endocarpon pusillum]
MIERPKTTVEFEKHVQHNSEGKSITQRQRESTHTQQKNWGVYLSLRKIRGAARTALPTSHQRLVAEAFTDFTGPARPKISSSPSFAARVLQA